MKKLSRHLLRKMIINEIKSSFLSEQSDSNLNPDLPADVREIMEMITVMYNVIPSLSHAQGLMRSPESAGTESYPMTINYKLQPRLKERFGSFEDFAEEIKEAFEEGRIGKGLARTFKVEIVNNPNASGSRGQMIRIFTNQLPR